MYLSLNDQQPANNSEVTVTEIGASMERALQCYTDNAECCNTTGRWFELGGAAVGDQSSSTDSGGFFVTKGPSVVRLHRSNNTSPIGTYCCEVPDARSINMISCVIIGGLMFVNSKIPFS